MMRARVLWLCFVLLAAAGLVQAHAAPSGSRPAGVGRGPVLRQGKPPRARGEVPATVGSASGPTMRGSAVYPAQDIPLRFTHDQHLGLGLACDRCHDRAASSSKSSELLVPTGAVCDECHGAQHPRTPDEPARCGTCHTQLDAKNRLRASLRMPRPLLHFDHAQHGALGQGCSDCHDMSHVRLGSVLQLPSEAQCLHCHDGFLASNDCATCHVAGGDGRLLLRAQDDRTLPALVPRGATAHGMGHDLAFVEDHRTIAKADPRACQRCHDDTFCTDCHDGAVRPMRIHASDYVMVHGQDARGAVSDCQSCHRQQSFCLGCHERLGFGDRAGGEFGVGGPLDFHPADWAGPPGMPQGHAQAAQRNLSACVSCHTEDSCLACHATTAAGQPGLDISPHGADFARSARCDALASHNRRVCLRCHAPGDPELSCL
ncbi:MAG: cytochrome c3 family protein [Nannocystaceae bacterium]|nr:cytochrome c3 family protein [Nannocystaceae bacterium]